MAIACLIKKALRQRCSLEIQHREAVGDEIVGFRSHDILFEPGDVRRRGKVGCHAPGKASVTAATGINGHIRRIRLRYEDIPGVLMAPVPENTFSLKSGKLFSNLGP